MAGEVVALGGGVTEWKVGDRVTSEFSLTRVHGETTLDNFNFGLGAPIDGVLSEYRHFPEQVG